MPVSEDALDWSRFERRLGNVDAIHVGLKSSIAQGGYPSGYELALAEEAVRRLCAVGRVYSLAFADIAGDAGARFQPVEYSKLEAKFWARDLRLLPRVVSDPVVLRAAELLAAVAEKCHTSPSKSEKLLIRFAT